MTPEKEAKIQEYNSVPVFYCDRCLSLYIVSEGEVDKCNDCGAINISQCSNDEWERLFSDKWAISQSNITKVRNNGKQHSSTGD